MHHLVKFNGKTSPDAANQWLKDLERIFNTKMCPADNMLAFTVYMLTGEAEHCWISMKSIMEEQGKPVTWEAFRGKFLSEYFPDSVRYAKEVEFLQLTQGGKSVTEDAEKFKHQPWEGLPQPCLRSDTPSSSDSPPTSAEG